MRNAATDEGSLLGQNGIAPTFSPSRSSISSRFRRSALIFGFVATAPWKPALSETIPCPDVLYLVEQSTTGFSSIRKEAESEFGGLESTIDLPGAEYCVIVEDVQKASYRCTWKYSYGDEPARTKFEQLASGIVGCLGSGVAMREDQAVNHPDTYEAYLIALPHGEARITLKDKSELRSTFVSFVIEGVR